MGRYTCMGRIVFEQGPGAVIRAIGRNIRWPILILCCWSATQCALRPVPRDLAVYINRDVNEIAGLEEVGLKRYTGLTGKNYISDKALRQALESQIIPAYTRYLALADEINPQTEPVRQLHSLYRRAAALRLRGFRTILLAIDTQDPDLVRPANRMLDNARKLVAQWQARLDRMAGQYGLERY
jgi:hypothetical protein